MVHCELCERKVAATTAHHLIPRTLHSNKWFKKRYTREQMSQTIDLCRDCHRQVHRFIPHKLLGREFNEVAKIKAHPQMGPFIEWIKKR
ncbi:MAG: hypothetical protein AAFR61_12125 [Bacteroidota bacterium]